MFGAYRLILAIFVVISHSGGFTSMHLGVWALVNFFIVSGFSMTALIRENVNASGNIDIAKFYKERLIRIYPQYLGWLIFSTVMISVFKISSLRHPYVNIDMTIINVILNLLIIPLNYLMFIGHLLKGYFPIMQAWSLGLEIQFYLLLPLIIRRFNGFVLIYYSSLFVFILAVQGIIDAELYSLRLLPGVLFLFLIGSYLYDLSKNKAHNSFYATFNIIFSYFVILLITLSLHPNEAENGRYVTEVCLGLLLGLPIIAILSRYQRNRIDSFIGNASYGTFLSHFIIIFVMKKQPLHSATPEITTVVVVLISVVLGFAGYYFFEKPFVHLRKELRARLGAS